MPALLLAAADREAEARCGGVPSHDGVAGRIHERLRSAYRRWPGSSAPHTLQRFTHPGYDGWLAAAACLSFGVYMELARNAPVQPANTGTATLLPTKISEPLENMALGLRQRAVRRLSRWFHKRSGGRHRSPRTRDARRSRRRRPG